MLFNKSKEFLNRLFWHKTDNLIVQMIRYISVSFVAYGIDITLSFVFTEFLHIYYLISSVVSSLVGGLFNYFASSKRVFNQSKTDNKFIEFVLFTVIGAFGLVINVGIQWLFTAVVGCHYMVAKIIAVFGAFLGTFFGRKYFLFTTLKK